MYKQLFVCSMIFSLLVMVPITVHAEHIFKDREAFAQYLDIAQIMAEKFVFEVGDNTYDVYYGYKGSLDSVGDEFVPHTLESMRINEERKSIQISMDEISSKTDMWVRVPEEVLYAENEKFQVLINGKDTGYDLMKFPNDYVVGFVISEDSKDIEIIGTKVIPEFGTIAIMILAVAITSIIIVTAKSRISLRV